MRRRNSDAEIMADSSGRADPAMSLAVAVFSLSVDIPAAM
jgi:hypothetical protein